MTAPAGPAGRTVDWVPSSRDSLVLTVVATVVTLLGIVGFALLYAWHHAGAARIVVGPGELVGLVVMLAGTALLVVLHELLHGLALYTLGHPARYGVTMMGGVAPAFYCTSPGARMSRVAFTWVALLPGLALAVAPLAWIGLDLPGSGWLVVPGGLLLGGAVGDAALTVRALASPRGTLVEDLRDGVRLHLPPAR